MKNIPALFQSFAENGKYSNTTYPFGQKLPDGGEILMSKITCKNTNPSPRMLALEIKYSTAPKVNPGLEFVLYFPNMELVTEFKKNNPEVVNRMTAKTRKCFFNHSPALTHSIIFEENNQDSFFYLKKLLLIVHSFDQFDFNTLTLISAELKAPGLIEIPKSCWSPNKLSNRDSLFVPKQTEGLNQQLDNKRVGSKLSEKGFRN